MSFIATKLTAKTTNTHTETLAIHHLGHGYDLFEFEYDADADPQEIESAQQHVINQYYGSAA